MKKILVFLSIMIGLSSVLLGAESFVKTADKLKSENYSSEYSVYVNDKEVGVYTTKLSKYYKERSRQDWNSFYSFASFDFEGEVEVKIVSSKKLNSIKLRPNRQNSIVQIKDNIATFKLTKAENFIIERNGDGRKDLLMLFANNISKAPEKNSDNLIYFAPGIHKVGVLKLKSNQSVYIADGAIVQGSIEAKGDNIKIFGRGILDHNTGVKDWKYSIFLDSCNNVEIDGIIIRKEARSWTIVPKECNGLKINNVKICGSFLNNDDGIDPVNSKNIIISNSLIRTKDDAIAIKGKSPYDTTKPNNIENIEIFNTILWSDECCAILLGDECEADYMRNITIRDCYIPYLSFEQYPKKFLMIHISDDMILDNILLKNIEIYGEGQKRNFIEICNEINQYSKSNKAGYIRNVTLENISLRGKDGDYDIVLKGYDLEYKIENLNFKNCTINDKIIDEHYRNLMRNNLIGNLNFE